MDRNDLIKKLLQADEDISMIYQGTDKIKVILVGGSSFVLKQYINRQTPDIDTLGLYRELEAIFNKYDINSRANAYSDNLPYNYEDRLEKVDIKTKIIEYYVLSLEDAVIMKLFSHRGKDNDDITQPKVLSEINWQLLERIVSSGELDYSFDEKRLILFKSNYNKYVKAYKPK